MTPINHLYPVILAGGSGERFWPLSRELKPKQFLSTFGGTALLTQALQRVAPFVSASERRAVIITNERLQRPLQEFLAEEDLPAIALEVLAEPLRRNTAPAIALVAAYLQRVDPQAILLILPSDHVMEDGPVWRQTLECAAHLAQDGFLVTLGLRPTHAETGYGYIEYGTPLPAYQHGGALPGAVARFYEKPELARAQAFIAQAHFYWNAGIFCMRAETLLEGLQQVDATGAMIVEHCRQVAALPPGEWVSDAGREAFSTLPSISIDCALLEKSSQVAVIPTALAWNDVGSLRSLESLGEADTRGNIRLARGVDIDSDNVTVYATDRLVATLGMADCLVVDTHDATLVCAKERSQDVRRVVDALRATPSVRQLVEPCASLRPWGYWTIILHADGYQIRFVEIKPGAQLRPHRHAQRSEHGIVLAGTARITCDDTVRDLCANEHFLIPAHSVHALENCGEEPLHLLEIHVGHLADDDMHVENVSPLSVQGS